MVAGAKTEVRDMQRSEARIGRPEIGAFWSLGHQYQMQWRRRAASFGEEIDGFREQLPGHSRSFCRKHLKEPG